MLLLFEELTQHVVMPAFQGYTARIAECWHLEERERERKRNGPLHTCAKLRKHHTTCPYHVILSHHFHINNLYI